MAIDTVAALLNEMRGSPILRPDQHKELVEVLAPQHKDPQELARQMIRQKWLTIYQAKKILSGKISELVIGNYTVLDKLGEGGMGRVYKAIQQNLKRVVALKVVRSSLLKNDVALKRFRREVKAAAALSHANIVRVFDADQDGDRHFLAMEYIDGSDLGKLVKSNGPLPIPVACSYIRQAALGLQHAHDLNFVHRDIKPSNLLVAADETRQFGVRNAVKILDMGLARTQGEDISGEHISTELTRAGTVVGTPDYMSPEQAKNSSNVDSRSDLYSLGCTFYYLLTGEEVFPNGNPLEKLLQHQLDAPRPIQMLRMEIPPEVASIVQCLLAKRPEQRFQSGLAVANALEPWCAVKTQPASNPALALAVEAVELGPNASFDGDEFSPFNFGDEEPGAYVSPPVRETRVVSTTPLSNPKQPIPEKGFGWKILLLIVAGVFVSLMFSCVGILTIRELFFSKSKPTIAVSQTIENPKIESPLKPKEEPKPKDDVKLKEEKLPDYIDVLEKFLPDDSMLVIVFDVKNFGAHPTAAQHVSIPLQTRFAPIKTLTGIDFFQKVERVVVATGDKKTTSPLVILQGRALAGEWLPETIRRLNIATITKSKDSNIEIAKFGPGKDDGKAMYAALVGTSVLICEHRESIEEALEKRDGARKTIFADPTVETGLKFIYRQPFTVTAVFGTQGRFANVSAGAKEMRHYLAGIFFDDKGMHFYSATEDGDSAKALEFQKALAAVLREQGKKPGATDERLEKLGDLFAEARVAPVALPRNKNLTSTFVVRPTQIDAWLRPFLEDKSPK